MNKTKKNYLASSFIHTLAQIIIREAVKNKISTFSCRGGVFQNMLLLKNLKELCVKNSINFTITS